jgi:hypothetical protein
MLHARHQLIGMLAGLLGGELVVAVEGVDLLQLLVLELREHVSAGQLNPSVHQDVTGGSSQPHASQA